jgi:hypothetical protein
MRFSVEPWHLLKISSGLQYSYIADIVIGLEREEREVAEFKLLANIRKEEERVLRQKLLALQDELSQKEQACSALESGKLLTCARDNAIHRPKKGLVYINHSV